MILNWLRRLFRGRQPEPPCSAPVRPSPVPIRAAAAFLYEHTRAADLFPSSSEEDRLLYHIHQILSLHGRPNDLPPLLARKPPSRLLEEIRAYSMVWDDATDGLKLGHFDAEARFVDVHVAEESMLPLCARINEAVLEYKAALAEIAQMKKERLARAKEDAALQASVETPPADAQDEPSANRAD